MSRNVSVTSIPIRIKDANGNLTRVYIGELLHGLYLAGAKMVTDFSAGDRYNGALLNNSTTSTAIGTFTDTVHAASVGNAATTITQTDTTLYQLSDSISALGDDVGMSADSDGNLYQQNVAELTLSAGLAGFAHQQEWPGITFKLGSTTPSPTADYEVFESNIFSDTVSGGTTTQYNIYRRIAYTPGITISYDDTYGGGVVKSTVDGKMAVVQATEDQIAKHYTLGLLYQRVTNGLGNYLLLSSTDGTPSANGYAGTWETRGTAIDTRRDTDPANFQGQREDPNPFVGPRDIDATFVGAEEQFTNAQSQKFAGTRDFVGQRESAQQFFSGQRTLQVLHQEVLSATSTIETYTLYVKTVV